MRRDGFVLVTVLSMSFLVVVMLVVASSFAVSTRQTVAAEAQKIPAFYLANAGLERAMAKVQKSLAESGLTYVNKTPEYVANAIAGTSTFSSGSEMAGGSFSVVGSYDSSVPNNPNVVLTSTGTTSNGAKRVLALSYNIYYVLKSLSDSAVSSNGNIVNSGNKLVEGAPGGTVSNITFAVSCTQVSGACASLSPTAVGYPASYPRSPVYSVAIASGTPPQVGDVVTLAGSTGTAVAYKVIGGDPLSGTLDLALIDNSSSGANGSGTLAPLVNGSQLAVTTKGTSLLTSTNNITTNGNGDTSCTTFSCGYLPVAPDKMFQSTFGVTKAAFLGAMPPSNILTADSCVSGSNGVQWINLPASASGKSASLDLANCLDARILVVRAPVMSATGNNRPTLDIDLKGGVFKGLLYVIGTNDLSATSGTRPTPPGTDVTVTGTDGAFMGAVIVENDVTGGIRYDSSGNPTPVPYTTKLAGTTPSKTATQICPQANGDFYNFCYDRTILAGLKVGLNSTLTGLARPSVIELKYSWSEKGN